MSEDKSERKIKKQKQRIIKKTERKKRKLEKKARKKPMKPLTRGILIAVFGVLFSCAFTAGLIGFKMLDYVNDYMNGPVVINLDNYTDTQNRTSILYAFDSDDKKVEIGRLHGTENREWVKFKKLPEKLQWAFVCLEDKRFYEHNGVDWKRTVAVLVRNNSQGGSTLTQQLIKNLTGQNQDTYVRKFHEILKALNLEKNYEKEDILEAYMNTIYLGSGCYGVKTAAEKYFGKKLKNLTIAECALLAGITQNPYKYNPYTNLDELKTRQKYCLDCMLEQGKITQKQYNKAIKQKIVIKDKTSTSSVSTTATGTSTTANDDKYQSYYVDYVIDEIIADLMAKYGYDSSEAWRQVYCGGLKIETAVDLDVQEIVEDVYENRTDFPYSRRDSKGLLPESSCTIMDYQGRIVAIVGGTGEKTGNRVKNRAATSFRQPGSSIKPLTVYAPCVDKGYITSGSQTVYNKAINLSDGTVWPRNYAGDYGSGAYITVETAVAQSLNTVPARLLYETLGVSTSYDYAVNKFHLAHLTTNDKDLSPLSVGGTNGGISTLEMASAYATFGNGGKYYSSYSYYRVLDKDGKVILDNTKNKSEQALGESASKTMRGILYSVTSKSYGTAYGCTLSGMSTFAKTGTTTDNYDKWMCIGSPYYVMSIWYGYDYPSDLGSINLKAMTRTIFTRVHKGKSSSRTYDDVIKECS